MRTEDAIGHYGSRRKLAEALGITTQSVYDWGDDVPEGRAYQLEVITEGALRAREERQYPTSPAPEGASE